MAQTQMALMRTRSRPEYQETLGWKEPFGALFIWVVVLVGLGAFWMWLAALVRV